MATMAQQRVALPTPTTMSMTDARRQLAAKPRSYGAVPAPGVMQPPTPQMRNSAGQMGPAVGGKPQAHATGLTNASQRAAAPAQQHSQAFGIGNPTQEFLQRQQFFQEQQNKRRQFDLKMDQVRLEQERAQLQQQQQMMQGVDRVPAMLAENEAVISAPQTQNLYQQGLLDNALGMTPQQLEMDRARRQQMANQFGVNMAAQRFATGGIVPTISVPGPQPAVTPQPTPQRFGSMQELMAYQRGSMQRANATPQAPTPAFNDGYDFARLRGEIDAFGQAPTMDDALMNRIRAQESTRLGNLYRGQLSELGAAAASSGALYGGDVSQLAAGFAAQRGQQEAELGTKLELERLGMQREDFGRRFNLAGTLAQQRAGFKFNAQEADLDRKWKTGERLSTQDWQTLEAAKERQFSRSERIDTQNFTAEEAAIARKWQSGERLSEQEWRSFESALDRTQQTSERLGAQQFTAEESQKQRALITDENAKDRLTQIALAEKNIEAQRQALDAQLAQARSENNLDRVQQLMVQRNQLGFQRQELRQQNDQFLSEMGLRRDVFDRGMVEFDLTRADQVSQFGQSLAQTERLAQMDDATRRWVTEMQDKLQRDINAAVIDPSNLQTLLSTIGTIAAIPGLGELVFGPGGVVSDALGGLFGGGGATSNELEGLKDAASSGSGIPWSTVGQAAVGAAGAYALIEAFNDPKSWSRTGQMIAGGAAIGSVLPGIGTIAGALVGGIAAGISSAFGPSARTVAKDAFTKQFDEAYGAGKPGGIERMKSLPADDPNSWANPQNRLAYAAAFAPAVQKAAALDVGDVEISDVDWRRMEGLGLAASVQGSDRARFYAIDDPRLIAMMGPGGANQYFTFEVPHQNNDNVYANAQGSLGAFIADGTLTVRDKATGEIIDFNNPEQLKAIAARNNPVGGLAGALAGTDGTPVGEIGTAGAA